jgi:hypothetical protein
VGRVAPSSLVAAVRKSPRVHATGGCPGRCLRCSVTGGEAKRLASAAGCVTAAVPVVVAWAVGVAMLGFWATVHTSGGAPSWPHGLGLGPVGRKLLECGGRGS